jgi:DNA polymerase III psi subunit
MKVKSLTINPQMSLRLAEYGVRHLNFETETDLWYINYLLPLYK